MTELSDQAPSSQESEARHSSEASAHYGLLVASGLLAGGALIVAGAYGIGTGSVALKALALESALVAIGSWLSLSACRIRDRFAALDQSSENDERPTEADQRKTARWGDEQDEEGYETYEVALGNLEHARKLHYLFLVVCPTAAVGLLAVLQLSSETSGGTTAVVPAEAVTSGIVCLAASCIWLVLAKCYVALGKEELPDGPALALAFREAQWASIVISSAILGGLVWSPLQAWVGRALLGWVVAVCGEQLGRGLIAWLRPAGKDAPFIPPLRLALREAVLVRGNPVSSLFEMIEARLGVSFRSSWAIGFVRRAITPAIVMVALMLWGLSGLSVVEVDHLGVRESFGRVSGAPLGPGLHWKLPWPFGRVLQYPVKKVIAKSIGFVSAPGRQPAFLWSKRHAQEEFALVLGDGSEVIAVGSMLYYKIREDEKGFLDYVYHCQNPDDALEAYAYRALMEQTRSTTLGEVLSANRARFADQLEQSVREYATKNHLGIDVVEVALIGLHPPVESAPDFLDVISAHIDADRSQIEATGEKLVQIQDAQRESSTAVATARVEAAKRVGAAQEESSEFLAIGTAYAVSPDALKLRLWFEILEEILKEKPFVLVDEAFTGGPGGILLDQRVDADTRDPIPVSRSTNP